MKTDDTTTGTGRFDGLEIASGDVVIYDTENNRAWVPHSETTSRRYCIGIDRMDRDNRLEFQIYYMMAEGC